MYLFRAMLSAAIIFLLVACGGGGNSSSGEPNPPVTAQPTPPSSGEDAPTPPVSDETPPDQTDPALSPTRLSGGWITSNGCGFDTGKLLITQGIDGDFTISLWASGSAGNSSIYLYPMEISAGEYSSTGMVEYRYRAGFRSSRFIYWEPPFMGDFALTMDGSALYMSSICAAGIDYHAMFTAESSSQQVHGDRFQASASAIQSQLRQQYDDAKREIGFDLSDRGLLNSSVAIRRYAELRAWYLGSLEWDLGVLINQYRIINLDRTYVARALGVLKQADLALFPGHQDEVEAMYNRLLSG